MLSTVLTYSISLLQQLRAFARLERGDQRLALNQPTSVVHDFDAVGTRNHTAQVRAQRFQTRFRQNGVSIAASGERSPAYILSSI